MKKNRSIWASLLSIVLAMVVMAGLAVAAFAVTDGEYAGNEHPNATVAQLEAALETGVLESGINYDVDGNGIIETDDLKYLKGELADAGDLLDQLAEESKAALQTKVVCGDSVRALAVTGNQSVTLTFASPVNLSKNQNLVIDALWSAGNAGSFRVVFLSDDKETEPVTVNASKAGWSAVEVPLAALDSSVTASVTGIKITLGEGGTTYFDNFRAEGTSIRYNVAFEGMDETIEVVVGRPYGQMPVPVKSFHTFEGWTLNGEDVTADTIVTAEAAHTLSGKWTPIASDDGTITVTDKGNNTFGLTMDGSYKQIRFDFMLKSGDFYMSYADNDSTVSNNPVITIVDANGNAVSRSKVQPGQWYTAFIYGGSVINESIVIQDGAPMATTGTLTLTEGMQLQVRNLETLTGQFGIRILGRNEAWKMTDSTDVVDGKVVNGYDFNMNANNRWDSRIAFTIPASRYDKIAWDFYVYEHATAAAGETYGMGFNTDCLVPTIYDMDGNLVEASAMKVGQWYRFEFDITDLSGSKYVYFYQSDAAVAAGHFKAYVANVNFVGDGEMIDNLSPATTVTVSKAGGDGIFVDTPVTRDTDRGTYRVAGTSANWYDRAIRIKLDDTTKELIQLDFRFVTSKDAEGRDVAPTLVATNGVSGTMTQAQYIIVDENDNPVTSLETGKWYRMFINANGGNVFGLVPAVSGEVELQLQGLDTFNTDELPAAMVSAGGNMSAVLTKFGKLEYVYAGNGTTVTVTLNSNLYKRLQFTVKGDATISASGATMSVTGSGEWKSAVITNDGKNLPKTLTLNVGAGSLVIKDLAASITAEAPEEKTQSDIFRGLDSDEMMIQGFIGPREEEQFGMYRTDQRSNPMASLARDDIFKLIADVGINYITDQSPSYSGSSKENAQHILRMAAKYGINYFMSAYDVVEIGRIVVEGDRTSHTPNQYASNIASAAAIKAKLAEMYQYESFGGLYLRDEPTADLFDEIRQAVEKVEQAKAEMGDVTLNQYVNLLPWFNTSGALTNFQKYTSPSDKAGNAGYSNKSLTWEQHLTASVKDTGMNYFAFDIYPFKTTGLDTNFLSYLGAAAKVSKDTGAPWMGYAQVGGGIPSYDTATAVTTEAELNWDVNAMLAFGAKGILYYINVTPPHFDLTGGEKSNPVQPHSLIDAYGDTTEYYDYVKDINAQIQAMDHVLMKSEHLGVLFGDTGVCGYKSLVNGGYSIDIMPQVAKNSVKLSSISGTTLIGAFDYNGKTALLVMNNTTDNDGVADTITLNFTGSYTYEVIQDAKASYKTGNSLALSLLPGRCALVVVHEDEVSGDVNVLFDLNYEGAPAYDETRTVSLNGDAAYPELPTPTRKNFAFDGWYADPDCTGEPVVAGQGLVSTNDHVLYAKWTIDTASLGYEFTYASGIGTYYGTVTPIELNGDVAFKHAIRVHTESTGGGDRRVHLNISNSRGSLISMKVMVADSSNNSALIDIRNASGTQMTGVFTDAQGNIVETGALALGQWYTLSWVGDGSEYYQIRPFEGTKINGTYYMKDISVGKLDAFSYPSGEGTYYATVTIEAMDGELVYRYTNRNIHSEVEAKHRKVLLNVDNAVGDVVSMKVMVPESVTAGTKLVIQNASGAEMAVAITDENGTVVENGGMDLGKWYTMSWIADGSAQYQIHPFEAKGVGGTFYMKGIKIYTGAGTDLTAESGAAITVKDNAGELTYLYRTKATNDAGSRVFYFVNDGNNQAVTYKLKFNKSQWSGAEGDLCYIRHYNSGFVYPVVTDENGNVVEQADRQVGVWYTVTLQAPAGTKLPSKIYTYTYGTGSQNDVDVELEIKDIVFTPYVFSEYDVSFDLNYEGAGTYNETVHVTEGTAYGTLPAPTRKYHTFGGWYTDAACTTAVTEETVATATQAHTLYAKWTLDTATLGYEFTYASGIGTYYSNVTSVEIDGDLAFKYYVRPHTESTAASDRRVYLNIANGEKQIMSMKVYFAACSGTPAIVIYDEYVSGKNIEVGQVITDAEGKIVDGNNLKLDKWYTVTWITDASAHYQIRPFNGTKIDGTFYIKDITIKDLEGSLASSYYVWVAPFEMGDQIAYMGYARPTPWDAELSNRNVDLTIDAASGDLISTKIMATETTGTLEFVVKNGSGAAIPAVVAAADGSIIDSTEMELNKWYTISWTADGSAKYQILSFAGTKATGTYYLKDIKVTTGIENPFRVPSGGEMYTTGIPAGTSGYYGKVTPVMIGDEIGYVHYNSPTSNGTNGRERRTHLLVEAAANQIITMDVYFTECNKGGAPSIEILRGDATGAISYTVTDADGNVVDSTNLNLNQWYTVTWTADGSDHYRIYPITGQAADGTYYIKDIQVHEAENFTWSVDSSNYASVKPMVVDEELVWYYTSYGHNSTNDPWARRMQINNLPHNSGDIITVKVQFVKVTDVDGNPSSNKSISVFYGTWTSLSSAIYDENGNPVTGDAIKLGEWYTLKFTGNGNSYYQLRTFAGTDNGTILVKDITVTPAS